MVNLIPASSAIHFCWIDYEKWPIVAKTIIKSGIILVTHRVDITEQV